mmetsp:Transcript_58989/g.172685  ORF Transcript_58989/g.172685 Transcript_58989/m.172685 type:complete len:291 (+) Transcript_58989:29-901(+)
MDTVRPLPQHANQRVRIRHTLCMHRVLHSSAGSAEGLPVAPPPSAQGAWSGPRSSALRYSRAPSCAQIVPMSGTRALAMLSAAGLPPEASVTSMVFSRLAACRAPGASEGSSARWSWDSRSAAASQAAAASTSTSAGAFPAAWPMFPNSIEGSHPTEAAAIARPSSSPRPCVAVPSQLWAHRFPLSVFSSEIQPAGSRTLARSRCPSRTTLRTCTVSPTLSCFTMVSCVGSKVDVTAAGATMQYVPGASPRVSCAGVLVFKSAAIAFWNDCRARVELCVTADANALPAAS